MTQLPSLAQGRWNHLPQFSSQHKMVAPLWPQTQQCWEEPSSPVNGSLGASPGNLMAAGRVLDVVPDGSEPTELPGGGGSCARASVEPLRASLGPTAGWKGQPFSPGVWAKLRQTSPGTNLPAFLSGSHLLCHPPDCKEDISWEKAHESNTFTSSLRKQSCKILQKSEGADEKRVAWHAHCSAGEREPSSHSPGRTRGHRARTSPVCRHRCLGQPQCGDTAHMLQGQSQWHRA